MSVKGRVRPLVHPSIRVSASLCLKYFQTWFFPFLNRFMSFLTFRFTFTFLLLSLFKFTHYLRFFPIVVFFYLSIPLDYLLCYAKDRKGCVSR